MERSRPGCVEGTGCPTLLGEGWIRLLWTMWTPWTSWTACSNPEKADKNNDHPFSSWPPSWPRIPPFAKKVGLQRSRGRLRSMISL